jgi:hypothetical protein
VAAARAVPAETIGRLTIGVDPAGVVLGRDNSGRAVQVTLLAPEPMSVAFVGGWWAARLLLFRCVADGATVTVRARDPHDPARPGTVADAATWLALDGPAGGGRVTAAAGAADPSPAGAPHPVLHLNDLGPEHVATRPAHPWQTTLTVLPRVTPGSAPLLAAADVLLVQRLPPDEAALLGTALGAGSDLVARVPSMNAEMVAVCGADSVRYVWLTPTPVERHLFG